MAPVILLAQEALHLLADTPGLGGRLALDPSGSALVPVSALHGLQALASSQEAEARVSSPPAGSLLEQVTGPAQSSSSPLMKTEGARCLLACTSWL